MIIIGNKNLKTEIKKLRKALDIQIDENDELRTKLKNREKFYRRLEIKAQKLQEKNTDLLNNIEILRSNVTDENKELIHSKEN